ncbi:DUF423 domain-containing protein [Lichenicola sp.]|uniref:DUF423 domain-containing protein n=1 Tax=Lichenicola sp. TaxID=2804529 RepID=UPI003B004D6F
MDTPHVVARRSTVTPPGTAWPRLLLIAGALLGLATVAMGAVAAHLPDRLLAPGGRPMLASAVQMQGWHAMALIATGLLLDRPVRSAWVLRLAGIAFLLGIVCFCAGVYALAFAGGESWARTVGHAAPFGGSVLMLGWLLLAWGCLRR